MSSVPAGHLNQREHWQAELSVIGPGLSEAVQWAGLVVSRAEGMRLFEADGREIVDLMGGAGVNLLGHGYPPFVAALKSQMDRWMIGAHGSEARLEMALMLREILPEQLDSVQLYSSGSEAVESALRLAKSASGKYEVVSFWNSFHGRTLGSLAHTSDGSRAIGPLPSGTIRVPFADCSNCPLGLTYPRCDIACVDLGAEMIKQQSSGSVAAILVEPVQGRCGNVSPPEGFLARIRALATRLGALLIADESMTGMGRTGAHLASVAADASPDIVVLGKGIGNGYPVSAVASSRELMTRGAFGAPSASSSSYGGFPLACQAVEVVARTLVAKDLAKCAKRLGDQVLAELDRGLSDVRIVREVCGQGLAIGIRLGIRSKEVYRRLFLHLLRDGLLVMTGGEAIRLYPPLTATSSDLSSVTSRLASSIAAFSLGESCVSY